MERVVTSPVILIIDDDAEIINFLAGSLKISGFETIVARNGQTGIHLAKKYRPGLILLDVMMTGMDGFETCRSLKAEEATQEIPVIFLTALGNSVDKVKGFESGAIDYITKPVSNEELICRINTHLTLQELQKQLRESEARYQAIVEDQTELICRFLPDGILTFVNGAYCRYFGKSSPELIGSSLFVFIPEADHGMVKQNLLTLEKEHPIASVEHRMLLPDGAICDHQWVYRLIADHNSQTRKFQAVGRDITEQRQVEEELQRYHETLYDMVQEKTAALTEMNEQLQHEIAGHSQTETALRISEQQYRLLAENIVDGVAIIHDETVNFVNTPLRNMLKCSKDALINKRVFDVFHCEDQKEHALRHQELLVQKRQDFCESAFCITEEGEKIWVDVSHTRIEWEGKPAILLTIRDITAQRSLERAVQEKSLHLQQENLMLKATLKDRYKFGELIGKSPAMQQVYELIIKAATSPANVVIQGATGVGKEMVARTIHQLSERHKKAFVVVNCGAVADSLFEREFFGHRKGTFTGAVQDRKGFFDQAHQGTLFLDELGELSPAKQVTLLRAIETGEYTPLGEHTSKKADVRIIAATNRNLDEMCRQGLLREDFYYRISVITITVPRLCERRQDLPLLIEHFFEKYHGSKPQPEIPGKLFEQFMAYDWPGNVRELQNKIQHYLALGQIDLNPGESSPFNAEQGLYAMLEHVEKQAIEFALQHSKGHQGKAAALLRIERRTLYKKMKKYRIDRSVYRNK